jgi:hypothetical protein
LSGGTAKNSSSGANVNVFMEACKEILEHCFRCTAITCCDTLWVRWGFRSARLLVLLNAKRPGSAAQAMCFPARSERICPASGREKLVAQA